MEKLNCDSNSCPLVKKWEDHEKRINTLEEFENWARPIIETIKKVEQSIIKITNSINWMTIVFVSFVAICTYVYQTDIKDYIKDSNSNKIEIIKEINTMKLDFKDEINKVKEQVITSSKINYNATVKKIKEYKDN